MEIPAPVIIHAKEHGYIDDFITPSEEELEDVITGVLTDLPEELQLPVFIMTRMLINHFAIKLAKKDMADTLAQFEHKEEINEERSNGGQDEDLRTEPKSSIDATATGFS